jgi:hypothetical protein
LSGLVGYAIIRRPRGGKLKSVQNFVLLSPEFQHLPSQSPPWFKRTPVLLVGVEGIDASLSALLLGRQVWVIQNHCQISM